MARLRTAVLISGRGSNMAALIAAAQAPDYPASIVLVLSDQPDAAGLALAHEAGVATQAFARSAFSDKAGHEQAIHQALIEHDIGLVALAGFMRLLSADFVAKWKGRLINIHPSLLPAYPGLDTHARALADGVREHGCTVHHVTAELDAGPILGQSKVAVMAGDDADSLAARVLEAEHELYPACLAELARQLVKGHEG